MPPPKNVPRLKISKLSGAQVHHGATRHHKQDMSALGQERTYAVQQVMSALPPIATVKADIEAISGRGRQQNLNAPRTGHRRPGACSLPSNQQGRASGPPACSDFPRQGRMRSSSTDRAQTRNRGVAIRWQSDLSVRNGTAKVPTNKAHCAARQDLRQGP